MAITTYDQLQSAISNFINDSDVSGYIPDFITLASSDIRNDPRARFVANEKRATATVSTTSQYLSLPSGFLSIIRMHVEGSPIKPLKIVPSFQLSELRLSTTSKPTYAAVTDGQFEFDCIPDSAYTVELVYDAITDLSSTNTTNETFPEYPTIYLYGALVHAAIFLKEDPAIYRQMYEKAMADAETSDRRKRYSTPLKSIPQVIV